jgi:hypothetical protein
MYPSEGNPDREHGVLMTTVEDGCFQCPELCNPAEPLANNGLFGVKRAYRADGFGGIPMCRNKWEPFRGARSLKNNKKPLD